MFLTPGQSRARSMPDFQTGVPTTFGYLCIFLYLGRRSGGWINWIECIGLCWLRA